MSGAARAARLMIVDDDTSFRSLLREELESDFPGVAAVDSAAQALEMCDRGDFDVVLLDIRMPDRDGLEVLRELKGQGFDGEIIMLTGHGTLDTAVRSLKMGAYDYLTKPCKLDELESIVQKAYEKRLLRRQNWRLRQVLDRQARAGEFVGTSGELQAVLDLVRRVAATDATVLIRGESGTGKELVAHAIHRFSGRSGAPFVVLDCTSLQESLLQSELFGHEKGAYTGASAERPGLFEIADGGTIFLDEIGDLDLPLQAKLLHVLDSGCFRRLGGLRDIRVDVRVLAATHHDLESMVQAGDFRNDLYFRLNVVSILVPPLRERKEDIPLLVKHFMRKAQASDTLRISRPALERLCAYAWPGNVRELQNVIERALIVVEGEEITEADLPCLTSEYGAPALPQDDALPRLKDLERLYIQNLLKRFSGHRARVAAALGISERSLYRKLRTYSLE